MKFRYAQKLSIRIVANLNELWGCSGLAISRTELLAWPRLDANKDEIFARKVFAGLQHGQPDRSVFSEDLNKYMSDAILAEYRSSLGSLGPVQSLAEAGAHVTDGLETRDYNITVGGHSLKLHMLLLPDGRLEDLAITDASTD